MGYAWYIGPGRRTLRVKGLPLEILKVPFLAQGASCSSAALTPFLGICESAKPCE